jgi:hypothetical protein
MKKYAIKFNKVIILDAGKMSLKRKQTYTIFSGKKQKKSSIKAIMCKKYSKNSCFLKIRQLNFELDKKWCGLFWADAGVGEPGRTVNPLAYAFGGSNPSPPTRFF